MPAIEITEAAKPAYVITMATVGDIMIAVRVVVMDMMKDMDIMDTVVVMDGGTTGGNELTS
jgi:methanogenic corrinoid protein MtbC1